MARGVRSSCCPLCGGAMDFDNPVFDFDSNRVTVAGTVFQVQPAQIDLFAALHEKMPNAVSIEMLAMKICGRRNFGGCGSNTLQAQVSYLRRVIKFMPFSIETVWGFGYRLVAVDHSAENLPPQGDPGIWRFSPAKGLEFLTYKPTPARRLS